MLSSASTYCRVLSDQQLSAVLRNSNQRVVIKVLKPGVENILQTDLNFLYLASKIIEFINPELTRVSLVGVVGDVRASMMDETDFRKEAQHIAEFSKYLDASGMRRVATCPYVYKQFTTKRCDTAEEKNPTSDLQFQISNCNSGLLMTNLLLGFLENMRDSAALPK